MNDKLAEFVLGMRTASAAERARLARTILDRELRPLLPENLRGLDDDAIVVLSLRPRVTLTKAQNAVVRAMRACIGVAESPNDAGNLGHLSLCLNECSQRSSTSKAAKAARAARTKKVAKKLKRRDAKINRRVADGELPKQIDKVGKYKLNVRTVQRVVAKAKKKTTSTA